MDEMAIESTANPAPCTGAGFAKSFHMRVSTGNQVVDVDVVVVVVDDVEVGEVVVVVVSHDVKPVQVVSVAVYPVTSSVVPVVVAVDTM